MQISISGALRPFFTQDAIADAIVAMPKPLTPLTDLLFPVAKRSQKTSPFIPEGDVEDVVGSVPVVRRGSESYSVDGKSTKINLIEVQPISLNRFAKGKELNDLIALGTTNGIQAYVNEVLEYLRDKTSAATEILVRQSLSGKIEYPMATAGSISEKYTVNFGTIKTLADVTIASDNLAKLQLKLEALYQAQLSTGGSGDIRFFTADDVYSKIVEIVVAAGNSAPVIWTDTGLTLFGKYKIMTMGMTYVLPGTSTAVPVIPAGFIQTVDITNAGKLFYAALDDLDANLAPLPFYAKPVKVDDPSGYKFVSESKPLPAPAISKMRRQRFLPA
jgi:hypothetical protein